MKQRIGTFNCQGILTSKAKQQMLTNDFEKYKLTALTIQETHIRGYGTVNLTSSTGKPYILYYSRSEINRSEKTELVSYCHQISMLNSHRYATEYAN